MFARFTSPTLLVVAACCVARPVDCLAMPHADADAAAHIADASDTAAVPTARAGAARISGARVPDGRIADARIPDALTHEVRTIDTRSTDTRTIGIRSLDTDSIPPDSLPTRAIDTAALAVRPSHDARGSRELSTRADATRPMTAGERLTGLSPQRIAAFRLAMAEIGGLDAPAPSLHFLADYAAPAPRLGPEAAPRLFPEDDTIVMSPGMVGRDLWAEEEFLIQGREDDFYDASRKWISRKIKGSDAAAERRAGRFAPRFAWDDGPLAGFRRGPIAVMGGEDQWSLRWSHKMARPGWVARIGGGVEDGEERIAFSIGRSLFHARTARK